MIIFALLTTGLDIAAVNVFSGGNPLAAILVTCAVFVITSFFMGMATGDYSWVDRFWSITPVIYVWILVCSGKPGLRLITASALVTLWGIRLTFNFARKGGYSDKEDYRWGELRKIIKNKTLWAMFNFFFISLYQHLLIVLFILPVYIIYLDRARSFGFADIFLSLLFLAFLALETIADQQQWDFQQKKLLSSGERDAGGDISRGFITHGLFRFSRHPNYFGEICIWWAVYFLGCRAAGGLFNWSCAGAVLLTLLFQGSAVWTETISGRKYPEYALYQKETSKIFPWFSKNGHDKLEAVKIPDD